jgi:ribonuclease T2
MTLRTTALAILGLCATAATQAATENYVFSVSWEPAFCETHASKPECQAETSSSFAANNFSLHGLWPQPESKQYCGVSSTYINDDKNGQWNLLPAVVLNSSTETLLQTDMPGTMSYLERHEWIKHGTCSGYSQQNYFAPALSMLGGVNGGNLAAEVRSDIGYEVPLSYLKSAARQDYGSMADSAIEYLCTSISGYQYLTEIRFHLALPSPLPGSLQPSYLVKPTSASSGLCGSYVVIDWVQ